MSSMKEFLKVYKKQKFTDKRKRKLKKILKKHKVPNAKLVLDESEQYIFKKRLVIYGGRAFSPARTRKQFKELRPHLEKVASIVDNFEPFTFLAMVYAISDQEDRISWLPDILKDFDPAIVEKKSAFHDAWRIQGSVSELQQITTTMLNDLPRGTRGGQENIPTLVDAIRGVIAIWENAGATPRRNVSNYPETGKPSGVFIEFLQVALYPLLPKDKRKRTLEDAIKKALKADTE